MKRCNACQITISTPAHLCPLCQGPLIPCSGEGEEEAVFPPFQEKRTYNVVKRILLFLSALGVVVCAVLNLVFTPDFWWWLLALTGVVYAWAVILHMLRRGGNVAGKILMQVVCLSALSILIDFETGYRGWSVSFMLPGIFCAGIVSVVILIACHRTNWAGYVLYQVVLALFGFIPLVLFFTGLSRSFWMALCPAFLAVASLLGLFFFSDKSIKNEFRRRLRF